MTNQVDSESSDSDMTDCTKVIVNNVVDGNEIYQNFYESFLGDEVELLVKKDGTLLDLKCEFEKEEGIEPARQRFFCGPVELEDDELPFYGLLELNNNTLDVVIPQASDPEVEVLADHNVWVVSGPSRNVFKRIILAAHKGLPQWGRGGSKGFLQLGSTAHFSQLSRCPEPRSTSRTQYF